ncbi:isocitrate lyase/phosphoenolpyruvate mutase family protein [Mucilaginibacter sp.]|jgi:2-methylisocitrate lyase-like PEP mutase family enzyme|uniref:isocitrate lyase/PEP mutase family protein n=1 Tax=Mucilaginibacter sp. TaxID=1882438 RepID=UPI002C91DD3D|nr:isocitrate lyase/phosphoenolpyruvate mutase family protein [Mucilaginibacter sp.]HTI60829.1 isocitrate lyase/phosphoenolpyruvate mutase family protein [Mucilaginibacter sp.]
MSLFKTFLKLHQGPEPLVLGNTWDVKSAQVFEAAGYRAIGISSQALSTTFGYNDGENLSFGLVLQVAKRVVETVNIPFTVDMEAGYSRSIDGIRENISKLHDAGVVGVNIEDTIPGVTRTLQSVVDFQRTLEAIAGHISRNNLGIFLNVRTDGFLLGLPNALEETLARIKAYENTGVNGIFTPCITAVDDIRQVVNATSLPINVMCMPQLPGFDELAALGVKRISMGPFLANKVYENAARLATAVISDKNFKSII